MFQIGFESELCDFWWWEIESLSTDIQSTAIIDRWENQNQNFQIYHFFVIFEFVSMRWLKIFADSLEPPQVSMKLININI